MSFRIVVLLCAAIATVGFYSLRENAAYEATTDFLRELEVLDANQHLIGENLVRLMHGEEISFDGVQSGLRESERSLAALEQSPMLSGPLNDIVRDLRVQVDERSELALELLSYTGPLRTSRIRVSQVLSLVEPSGTVEESTLLASWLAFTLVPSGDNLVPLLQKRGSLEDPPEWIQEIRPLAATMVRDWGAAVLGLDRVFESPILSTVALAKTEARKIRELRDARDAWHAIIAIIAIIGLVLLVEHLYNSLRVSLDSANRLNVELDRVNNGLEETVKKRTVELQAANQSLALDIERREQAESERDRMENELRLAQKLEAVGQLAAGVAHEINTPVQYVSDNAHFLKDAFNDFCLAQQRYRDTCRELFDGVEQNSDLLRGVEEADSDCAYLTREVPQAIESQLEGLEQISTIVRSLNDFAHTGSDSMHPADLNAAIETTLHVARNEYKYVADIELELGEIPHAVCFAAKMKQVLLNLIVNASDAIREVVGDSGERGTIRIRSEETPDSILITVEDSGGGIPDEVRERVFDPFFTTKEVGKGSGQGLAIVYNVVVECHGGTVNVESAPGGGTRFIVEIPLRELHTTDTSAAA